jgi:UDP-N-acetylglucosamine 2-epimerase (non-hydrolysing)
MVRAERALQESQRILLGDGGSDPSSSFTKASSYTNPEQIPRIAIAVGTRPEVIKLAPVCRALDAKGVEVTVVLTGQHRELVDDLLAPLEITGFVDADLDVMQPRQDLSLLAAYLLQGLGAYLAKTKPDALVVQGDTTSALCGALAAFHAHIPVAHVEAGLRSETLDNPFPEELNRQMISRIGRWQFAPTSLSYENLAREGIGAERAELVGNTVVDSLHWVLERRLGTSAFSPQRARRRVLVTLHRRETRGAALAAIAASIAEIARVSDAEVVFPIHPSPEVREAVRPVLETHAHVRLCEPLSYFDFLATLADADLAISDSGGVQEEAPTLRTPVLVVRETTERREAIDAGCARLVGTDPTSVQRVALEVLGDDAQLAAMVATSNPFGDGHAAERIADRLLADLVTTRPRVALEAAR